MPFHALELARMGVAPSFVAELLALFGEGLLQIDARALGRFDQLGAGGLQQAAVSGVGNRLASGHFAADDYDFKKPKALLDTRQQQPAGHPQDSREIYDWPGGYTEVGDGENYARVRIEQLKAEREVMHGFGNARNLAPGYLFTLAKYPRADQNQQYLIEAADYRFEENVYRSDGAGGSGAAKRGGADSPTTYR